MINLLNATVTTLLLPRVQTLFSVCFLGSEASFVRILFWISGTDMNIGIIDGSPALEDKKSADEVTEENDKVEFGQFLVYLAVIEEGAEESEDVGEEDND